MSKLLVLFLLPCIFYLGAFNFVSAQGPPTPPSGNKKNSISKKKITLDDLWKKGTFSEKSIHGLRSMKDGIHYTTMKTDKGQSFIIQNRYETGEPVDTLFRSNWFIDSKSGDTLDLEDYQFSDDENRILISTGVEPIYRHSTREFYYIWDRKSKNLTLLSEGEKQGFAAFSPTGSNVGFVREYNLFVKNVESGVEAQITIDGKFNNIINGSTDWVYEEEFGFDKAFFWSPDAEKIAFYRFDESNVREFTMTKYGELYPVEYKFKYPKAGEENSKVSIHIYNVKTKNTVKVDLGNSYEYVPRIKWTDDPDKLSIQGMNRHQNQLDLLIADAITGKTKVILSESRDTYIDITDNLNFLNDRKRFIWSSDKDGYNHLFMYDISGKQLQKITSGSWDVAEFLGVDEQSNTLYYISSENINPNRDETGSRLYKISPRSAPLERNLFSIGLEGDGKKLLTENGDNNVSFSEGFKYYINAHSTANEPSEAALYKSTGEKIRVLEDNSGLKKTLPDYDISNKEFFKFTTSENVELNGWMIKPSDFNEGKKYPVLMFVYGGPGAQTVLNKWDSRSFLWYQMLAQNGYIIVSVDNRGTGARGADFKKCTYKELGKLETVDQIEAAKYLARLPYIDKNRIGIWGWSYGGYMTSLCMTKGSDYFKVGIAVAPVTNWRFYDSIYTERYMQTPQENPKGYDDNSPINHVAGLKGKYLLIHGSADDNVHFQNTIAMTTALVNANKQFDLFVYPDKNHGIYGGNTHLHLYTKMTDYILGNL